MEYANRKFVHDILSDIPSDASLTVGREFALDAYGQREDVILACNHPMYFDSAEFPTDLLVIGRRDHEARMIESYRSAGLRLSRLRTFGDAEDPLGCYAELWSVQLGGQRRVDCAIASSSHCHGVTYDSNLVTRRVSEEFVLTRFLAYASGYHLHKPGAVHLGFVSKT